MSWHTKIDVRDDVALVRTRRLPNDATLELPLPPTDEAVVRGVVQGLAERRGLSVAEAARKLERGMWSREHSLAPLRLQWAFEKMCDEGRFADAAGVRKGPRG
ncbi:MAG TPA: hypothetical protein VGG06_10025 [Thermoanaerobaculia bacterium]|jgi:hypothetical protein